MKKTALFIILFVLFLGIMFWVLLHAQRPGRWVLEKVISQASENDEIVIEEVKGSLAAGMRLENLVLNDVKGLPENAVIKVDRFFINITQVMPVVFEAEVINARLLMPYQDPVVANVMIKDGKIDGNLFSNSVTVNDVKEFLKEYPFLRNVDGRLSDVDVYVQGEYERPAITGSLVIEDARHDWMWIKDVPVALDLKIADIRNPQGMNGEIRIQGGQAVLRKTPVTILPSTIFVKDPLEETSYFIEAKSRIDNVRINIRLKGTRDNPDLHVSSTPPLPRQQLLVMLATNQRWSGVEDALTTGEVSADVVKEFVDYFFFDGQASSLAKKLGVSEVSLTVNRDERGISVTKDVTDRFSVDYGIKEKNGSTSGSVVSQKVGGDMKITDKVTVGVERNIEGQTRSQGLEDVNRENNENIEDKIMLKYKKRF